MQSNRLVGAGTGGGEIKYLRGLYHALLYIVRKSIFASHKFLVSARMLPRDRFIDILRCFTAKALQVSLHKCRNSLFRDFFAIVRNKLMYLQKERLSLMSMSLGVFNPCDKSKSA